MFIKCCIHSPLASACRCHSCTRPGPPHSPRRPLGSSQQFQPHSRERPLTRVDVGHTLPPTWSIYISHCNSQPPLITEPSEGTLAINSELLVTWDPPGDSVLQPKRGHAHQAGLMSGHQTPMCVLYLNIIDKLRICPRGTALVSQKAC